MSAGLSVLDFLCILCVSFSCVLVLCQSVPVRVRASLHFALHIKLAVGCSGSSVFFVRQGGQITFMSLASVLLPTALYCTSNCWVKHVNSSLLLRTQGQKFDALPTYLPVCLVAVLFGSH